MTDTLTDRHADIALRQIDMEDNGEVDRQTDRRFMPAFMMQICFDLKVSIFDFKIFDF